MINVHDNPGEHLDGGIEDDGGWQDFYRRLITMPNKQYNVPKRAVDNDFILTLGQRFDDIRDRKCNMDKLLTFQMVILQREEKTGVANGELEKRRLQRPRRRHTTNYGIFSLHGQRRHNLRTTSQGV